MSEELEEIIIYPLHPKQEECSLMIAKYRLFWGARGGWKSYWLRSEVSAQCNWDFKVRWLVLRRTFPEVYENTIIPICTELPQHIYNYNQSKWIMTFDNWSTVKFSFCRNLQDVLKYQWVEYDFIAIEELTHWTFKEWKSLMGSLRSTKKWIIPNFFATTNPWGIWHNWVKRLWINREFEENEYAEEYSFTQSFVYDNPTLIENDPLYVQALEWLPEIQRKAFLEWDWDVFEWQYFTEWRREIHVCKNHLPEWRKIICWDYGYSKPSAIYWLNKSTTWKITCYRELYVTEHTYKQLAIKIKALTWIAEEIECVVIDPAVLNKKSDSTWTSFLDEAWMILRWKIIWANNKRIIWWNVVREALRHYFDPNSDSITAILEVCETCFNLIQTLPELIYDKVKVEDLNSDWEDHAADALRYWLMYLWVDKLSFKLLADINKTFVKWGLEQRKRIWKKRVEEISKNNILKQDF